MRWSRLFDDLEAQLLRSEQAERAADASEQQRMERSHVTLGQALAADCGSAVTVLASGMGQLSGQVGEVGLDWFTIDTDVQGPQRTRSVILALASVQALEGLTGFADQRESASQRRFGLGSALRALSRDRARVRVFLTGGGCVEGTIDAVANDHVTIADHHPDAPRRREAVRGAYTVPLWAVSAVRQV